ncbi:hypothetical protein [Aneurinibacillus migulanus]|uniref:hypothetical protein n=1 Tax=Aneurinibacillus migulanus TaxID=47500 RepID=UPI001269BC74|nr:hypothetical protein [Aneurinibacillus migulanus]
MSNPYIGKKEQYIFSVDLNNNTFITRAVSDATHEPLNNNTDVRLNGVSEYDVTEVWASRVGEF